MTVTLGFRLRSVAGMGLWCNGSTALRQSGRCGFDSRQVHVFSRCSRRRSIMGEPGDGARFSFRKLLITC